MAPPAIKKISSRENDIFGVFRDALESKGIRKHGLFHVFGARAVRDTLNSTHASLVRNLIICSGLHGENDPLVTLARQNSGPGLSVVELAKPLFEELDLFGTKSPIALLKTPSIPALDLSRAPEGLEILCALGDPSNVGALARSAAAFGASRIILLQESASPFHPRAVRAASAATLLTPFVRGPSIRALEGLLGPLVALDMQGTDLTAFRWPKDVRLLLGEEGLGVPPERKGALPIRIPMQTEVESLNATVAASIALYSYRAIFPLRT